MTVDLVVLGRAVKQAQYRNQRAIETALATIGSTLAQWDALRAIGNNPGSSAHWLAGETFQSDQAFGALAGRLEAQQLIERRIAGRRIEHFLTPAGEGILEAGRPLQRAVVEESFGKLNDGERKQLFDLLERTGVA